ncbi:citramalyl-CoA lyase, mitochondrial [Aplysia californica]|uniref:Citramalyl-CoA lyase, mitochondrial n=1 Tax=Aplysia californica TaxID=6500 RepID=A0ABM0JGS3_APLCA|nr:citramalyl-CoA lyase, mitochondrial [Aplysia californica]XP_005093333.1 citramalyl-CoA lyase, mitochondrial [Aplysia californica]
MKGMSVRYFSHLLQSVQHFGKSPCSLCRHVTSPKPCWASLFAVNNHGFFTKTDHAQDGPFVPRRTLMYVPGHDPRKLGKIPNLGVDCAVLECEDGVALNKKEDARKNIKEALSSLQIDNIDVALRVNSVSSGMMEDDLTAIIGQGLGSTLGVEQLPHTILLPKVDSVEDLIIFTDRLQAVKLGRDYCPYLITYVESAQGLMNMKDVLHHATEYSKDGVYKIDGVVFGSDDFCADIGAERTLDAKELTYARQKIVMVAKAFRIQAIDMVYVDIHDKEGLRVQSEEGARKGYTGKQVIHPGQVAVVEAAFTPSPARVEWATELIQGFDEHQASGKGAFTFRGQMIDMPLLRQAKNVLQIVKNVHPR